MIKPLILLALSLIFFSGYTFAQTDETCGTIPAYYRGESIDLNQEGGIYLTSQGELKVLVVFVRFKDDVSPHPYWPAGQPPQNHTTFIDPNLQTNSTHYINLTNYFKKMSLGVYKVTGQVLYVETPQNKSYYGTPLPNRFLANKDVLQNVVDPLINFNEYDNWSTSSNYNHQNQSDGTVDMIIMIWRGLVFADWWSGEASLGYNDPNPPYNSFFYVENGTKLIKTGFGSNAGSGVTVHYWGERSPERNFKVTVHEVAHWLLGGSHPYGSGNDQHLVWGMLTGGNEGICANTYERERLAWVNPTPITGDVLNAPLHDYVEYGIAYKYHPPNGETNEYYYFENHQKLSIYDNATSNTNNKGIFVIHQRNLYSNSNNIRIKTSNGQWDWENPFNANCWNNDLPAFNQTDLNRNGYSNRDKITAVNNNSTEWLFAKINEDNIAECGDWSHGWGFNNSFNLSYNDVFSPYSNPWSKTWDSNDGTITMEIFNENNGVINTKFYITDPLAGKPSKPQNFTADFSGENPSFTWEANIEPDLAGYRVYKELTTSSGTMTTYAFTTSTAYTDDDFTIGNKLSQDNAEYWLVAVDNDNFLSVETLHYNTNGTSWIQWKTSNGNEIILSVYMLNQNYPNPFNPNTTIDYAIKKDGLVTLKIYDLLGRELETLISAHKPAGNYSVEFNAEQLPSGIYVYRLTSGNFTTSKKLILMK